MVAALVLGTSPVKGWEFKSPLAHYLTFIYIYAILPIMSKIINKNLIGFGKGALLILGIFALSVMVMPLKASAAPTYVPGHYNSDGSYTYGDFYWPETKYITTSNNTSSNTTTTSNSNSNYSNNTQTQNSNGYNGANGNNPNNNNADQSESSLAASVIFGSNGVMPSGLIQWILLAIVILLIIILVRKISGGAERYHNEPLKHA